MRAAVLTAVGTPIQVRDVPRPDPGPGQVRVAVRASGICGTDIHIWHGTWAGPRFPAVLGHEPVGEVEALGPGVTALRVGDRVGVSWTQRGCGRCRFCQEERAIYCGQPITWMENGGGHAEYLIAEETGCTLLPDGLSWEAAAPCFCAGFTAMSGYRNAAPRPGDRIGILGMGGLGHLALQIARVMGHETVAITRSSGKVNALRELGADQVLVADGHVGQAVHRAGGVDVLLSMSNDMRANGEALWGLREEGRFVTMAIGTDPIPVDPNLMHSRQLVLKGSMLNQRQDLVEILSLVAGGRVRPVVEAWPPAEAQSAFDRLARGDVRFRAVLVP